MLRRYVLISVLVAAVPFGTSALADVKSGIDAYQRGDFANAVGTWRPLAAAGDADAQYNLGQAYRLGRGVPADSQMAESWFKRAADQGHLRARNAYGLTLFQNGRRAEAIPFVEEAAGHGFPQAQYVFATLLFNGDMVQKDWVRSYALMTRAAAGDVAAARGGLAQLDQYIPLEQRQRGLKLAQMFEAANTNSKGSEQEAVPEIAPALPRPQPKASSKAAVVATAKPDPAKAPIVKTPVPAVATKPAVGGAWRVQLGAFSSASSANALWKVLQGRIGALAPYQSFVVPAGAVTRLQAGPLPSRAAADRLCVSVKASGAACLPVAP